MFGLLMGRSTSFRSSSERPRKRTSLSLSSCSRISGRLPVDQMYQGDRMARDRIDSETARISPYAKFHLGELVDKVSTNRPVLPVKEWDLVGALILAAHEAPLEAVKAVFGSY